MKGLWEIASDAGAKLSTLGARKQGAIVFAGSIAVIGFAMIVGMDRYSRMLLLMGVCLLTMSLWVMVTGRAGTRNEPKPPLWWWAGTIVVLLIALVAAFGVLTAVEG